MAVAYLSDEEDFEFDDDVSDTLDYSHRNLIEINTSELVNIENIKTFHLNSNLFSTLPNDIEKFQSLITLELSDNQLTQIPSIICSLKNLKNLYLKNNLLNDYSLPKQIEQIKQLEIINFGGNRFKRFPSQLFKLIHLKEIYFCSNQIQVIPNLFQTLTKVEALYLGGNQISHIPDSIGYMQSLIVLNLSDNRLRTLPRSISRLTRLKSLSLHNNEFCALPPDIIRLDLQELSLRNNPLVVHFVRDLTYNVPTLKELSARTIKYHQTNYDDKSLPKSLIEYLNSAKSCLNPKCKGVYFESCHKNIKFVDFCGKFYLPLLQFLCSPACTSTPTCPTTTTTTTLDSEDMSSKFKKVLLG